MSLGVSLPHFTSPSSNGYQIGFFSIGTRADTQKKDWGYSRDDTHKKWYKKFFFLSVTRVHSCDTSLHSSDTSPLEEYWVDTHTCHVCPRAISFALELVAGPCAATPCAIKVASRWSSFRSMGMPWERGKGSNVDCALAPCYTKAAEMLKEPGDDFVRCPANSSRQSSPNPLKE